VIGRFHEFSVHAPEVLASLEFYERLGFVQASTGEAWPYPYAVVTDGRIGIGLHQRELPGSPLLSFVLPDLLHRREELEAGGCEILERTLGNDAFNQAALQRPPGLTSTLGWFEEVALPVADAAAALRYWERLGFVPAGEESDPYPHVGLTSDALSLALLPAGTIAQPTLVFTHAAMPARIEELRNAGLRFAKRPPAGLDPARNALLIAPEGTQILLTASA
jgi:catechol 2,3-dioxygenase-like lactoylglutathione lyase family enzyme